MDHNTFFFVFIVLIGVIVFLIGFVLAVYAMSDRIEPEETAGSH